MDYEHHAIDRLVEQAAQRYRFGDYNGGIELLKEALSVSPDSGYLHSYLSIGLIRTKRLAAAEYEARLGLEMEPNSPYAHYTFASLLHVKRDFKNALEHLEQTLAIDPEDVDALELLSRVYAELGHLDKAKSALDKALELAPDEPDVLVCMAEFWVRQNQQDRAEHFFNEALSIEPQHLEALVGKGHVLLRKGEVEEAREHAIWALQQEPNNSAALGLLTAVKTRKSFLMGSWWRINSWLVSGNDSRTILLMISAYVIFRVLALALGDLGFEVTGAIVSLLWIGIVIYMWVGPAWFSKKLKAELQTVTLKNDF